MVALDVIPSVTVTIHGVITKREVPAISPTAGMTVESVEVAGAVTSGVLGTIVIGDWTSQSPKTTSQLMLSFVSDVDLSQLEACIASDAFLVFA